MSQPRFRHLAAFSLIELSVVLVIIGLIVAGVTTGTNLLRASRINAVATEIGQYRDAIDQFEAQYAALPGDMPNAQDYWQGRVSNGDGDGVIAFEDGGSESHEVWRHLAEAGYVQGSFTGNGSLIPAVSIPAASMDSFGYGVYGTQEGNAVCHIPNGPRVDYNALTFGAPNGEEGTNDQGVGVELAFLLDQKIDDGMPQQGHMLAMHHNCITGTWANWVAAADDPANENYDIGAQELNCMVYFRLNRAMELAPETESLLGHCLPPLFPNG